MILNDEIDMYSEAIKEDDEPVLNDKHELSTLGVRRDTLLTLREKLKMMKEFE